MLTKANHEKIKSCRHDYKKFEIFSYIPSLNMIQEYSCGRNCGFLLKYTNL